MTDCLGWSLILSLGRQQLRMLTRWLCLLRIVVRRRLTFIRRLFLRLYGCFLASACCHFVLLVLLSLEIRIFLLTVLDFLHK